MMMSNIGRMIYGSCNGYFGRDEYSPKRIEAEGADWVVARALEEFATPLFAAFESRQDKEQLLESWAKSRN
jgi:hypothetical protein